jgi:ABC-type sugar transport system ATPase subunit
MTISSIGQIVRNGLISHKAERDVCVREQERLRIKAPSMRTHVRDLSGGNQQKVVIAKWLLTQASIFIFDEPTRGIDVGAKAEIHRIMIELLKGGAAIIMISSEIPEILALSDRILVLRLGRTEALVDNRGLTQEDVLGYAMGAHNFSPN